MAPRAPRMAPWLAPLAGCLVLAGPPAADPPGPAAAAIDRAPRRTLADRRDQAGRDGRRRHPAPAGHARPRPGGCRRPAERDAFAADTDPAGTRAAVRRLVRGPEFAWYFATVLDEVIQGRQAGGEPFVGYLRGRPARQQGVGRDLPGGPDRPLGHGRPQAGRRLFLDRRVQRPRRADRGHDAGLLRGGHLLPAATTTRWSRTGSATTTTGWPPSSSGPRAARGASGEKADGEAKFAGKDGKETVAPMMFLTGRAVGGPREPEGKVRPPGGAGPGGPGGPGVPEPGVRQPGLGVLLRPRAGGPGGPDALRQPGVGPGPARPPGGRLRRGRVRRPAAS